MDGGFLEMAQQCAPMVDSTELAAIVSMESGFNPFHIRINSDKALSDQPKDKAEAIEIATSLRIEGQIFDLGLGGISSQSLDQLGLTIADAFDACKNMAATGQLVATYYAAARVKASRDPGQDALWTYFGRGDPEPGRITGYDKQIRRMQEKLGPDLTRLSLLPGASPHALARNGNPSPVAMVDKAFEPSVTKAPEPPQSQRSNKEALNKPENVPTGPWDIFSSTRNSQVFIFNK